MQKGTGSAFKVGRLLFGQTYLFDGAGAPTNGTSGTGAGVAGPGSIYVDRSNGAVYTNVNTKASPTWEASAGVVDGSVRYAEVALTNAEIKALRATPKLLVAAPGAGKLLQLHAAILILDAGSNALTESADNLDIRYVGKASGVLATVEATGFIDQTTDQAIHARVANDKLITKANSENLGIELFNNGDGEFGGNAANDATMRVKLWYSRIATGW